VRQVGYLPESPWFVYFFDIYWRV